MTPHSPICHNLGDCSLAVNPRCWCILLALSLAFGKTLVGIELGKILGQHALYYERLSTWERSQ